MLITDVHAKWTAFSPAGPHASGARFSSRHCKGAPATHQLRHALPSLQMASVITSPINCFAPVEYWQNLPGCRSFGCRVKSDDAANCKAHFRNQAANIKHTFQRPTANSAVSFRSTGKCDACHFILNEAARMSALAGRAGRP
jgi:hypothetical protein